jgi:hypothetical protein
MLQAMCVIITEVGAVVAIVQVFALMAIPIDTVATATAAVAVAVAVAAVPTLALGQRLSWSLALVLLQWRPVLLPCEITKPTRMEAIARAAHDLVPVPEVALLATLALGGEKMPAVSLNVASIWLRLVLLVLQLLVWLSITAANLVHAKASALIASHCLFRLLVRVLLQPLAFMRRKGLKKRAKMSLVVNDAVLLTRDPAAALHLKCIQTLHATLLV